ncbi:MAG TPA: hypothetical protein VK474_13610 [Chthoniobacterales bacterium]|nr:hypothetical protein [Chthoniobacterales bacterium]
MPVEVRIVWTYWPLRLISEPRLWQQGIKMPQIKMSLASPRIIKTRPVIASPPDEPLVRGHGDIDYICAGCDRVIAENIELWEIKNLVFECSACGTDNQIP